MDSPVHAFFHGKCILVLGGTGSWGSELVRQLVELQTPGEIRVFSRGEHEQVTMRLQFRDVPTLRFVVGDIRDAQRVRTAMKDVDIVFNLAALKHVPVCEENVWEAVQTNIVGVQNVVTAAMEHGVETVVQVSSDKAVDPLNVYGYTKGVAERLVTSASHAPSKPERTKFVCVRAGNVLGTTGSVVPLFVAQIRQRNRVTLTHEEMSRFFMRQAEAIALLLKATVESTGGEVFVTQMPGARMRDFAEVMIERLGNATTGIETIGVRPGEKMHEVLVSKHEASRTVVDGTYYVILPQVFHRTFRWEQYRDMPRFELEEYTSRNTRLLAKEEIAQLLEEDGWFRESGDLERVLAGAYARIGAATGGRGPMARS